MDRQDAKTAKGEEMMERYQVVTDWPLEDLAAAVNELMAKGWTPCGGISYIAEGDVFCYAQAMVLDPISDIRAAYEEMSK